MLSLARNAQFALLDPLSQTPARGRLIRRSSIADFATILAKSLQEGVSFPLRSV